MTSKIFEIYRKILSIEQLDLCKIHTDGGILFLDYDNSKFDELLKIIITNSRLIFDCVRKDKKFFVIDIKRDKLKGFEATISNIEKNVYTENLHITTDPFKILILNKSYTDYNKLYDRLVIGNTYLFLLNCNQLLDVMKPLRHTSCIEVSDIIYYFKDDHINPNNYVEIKAKHLNIRFLHNDSFLNIGCKYKITYCKSFGSNFYKIIRNEPII